MKQLILFTCFAIIIFFISCKKSTEPVLKENILHVTIKNQNGNAIEGVGLHYYADLFNIMPKNISKITSTNSVILNEFYNVFYPNGSVKLIWSTSSETANAGFEIFRSTDSTNYSLLSSFKTDSILIGAGTTQNVSHYFCFDTISTGKTYLYRLTAVDTADAVQELDTLRIHRNEVILPSENMLYQNYPNPFNPETTIRFQINKASHVSLVVFNEEMSQTCTLLDREISPGIYQYNWNGKNDFGESVTNNVYQYKLEINNEVFTKKLCLNMADTQYIKSLNCVPLAKSNSNGEIELGFNKFPLGEEVVWTDAVGVQVGTLTIPDTLHLFFIKDGYNPKTEKVIFQEGKGISLNVTMD